MNSLKLLKQYPLSSNVIKEWFFNKLVESIKYDDTVPEEFKEYMLNQGIAEDKLSIFIDNNPRGLFDLFDENNIIIIIGYHENFGFNYSVCEDENQQRYYKTRKEAEQFAIEVAFEILEQDLKQKQNGEIISGTDSSNN